MVFKERYIASIDNLSSHHFYIFNILQTALPYILSMTPAGVSVRQGIHYIQQVRDGSFRQFDYDDVAMNREKYGRDSPPEYDLSQVTVPVNIFGSMEDKTANIENVRRLIQQLPNVKLQYVVPTNEFGHADFIYSRYLRYAVNDKLLEMIHKANQMG